MRKTPPFVLPFLFLCALGAIAARARAQGDTWIDPRKLVYPPLRPIQVPEPERTVLPNGMVVYLLEDHDFPLVDARALIRVGSIYEPTEKTGLARLTGEVMRTGGSTAVDGDSLDRVLEGLGASVEISIGDTQGTASVSTLSEDLQTGLDILADLLRRPAFPQEKLDLAKTSARTAIAGRNDEMMSILFREFPKQVLGPRHPYARHTEYATIDAIVRGDLVDFHRRYFHPDRIILTVYGDFNSRRVRAILEKSFRDWPRSTAPLPPDPVMPSAARPGTFFADKPDATNTGIIIGHLGLRMDDPDYPAMSLLNEVLGGGFSGRLINEIRTKRGLAYNTSSSPGAGMHHPGSFMVYAMTQADSSAATTGYLMKEILKVLSEPVTAEEIARARDGILNSLVFTLSSKGAVLNRLAEYEYYGYPRDFLQRYQDAIGRLTPEDLLAAARRRIRPQEMVTLLVGNGQVVKPQLSGRGDLAEIDISIPEAGSSSGNAPGGEPAPAPSEADFEVGRALLQRAARATFPRGAEALRDLSFEETGSFLVLDREFPIGGKTVRIFPECLWTEQKMPQGILTSAFCDGESWQKSGRGVRDLNLEEVESLVRGRAWDPVLLLRDLAGVRAHVLPGEWKVGDQPADAVSVDAENPAGWKILFDRGTGRVAQAQFEGRSPQGGAPTTAVWDFRDYRLVGGVVWLPHFRQRSLGGKPDVILETTAASANTSPDRSIFARPAE